MSKIFIDTNILVYVMDKANPKKQNKCRSLLRYLTEEKSGVISTQVLLEFYVVSTQKLQVPPLAAKEILHSFEHFEVVTINSELIKTAIDCSILQKLSFWDSLIISAAESAKCSQLWTEDLNSGQIIRGIEIINPIKSIQLQNI